MIDAIYAGHSIFLIQNIKIDYIVIIVPGYMYSFSENCRIYGNIIHV